MMTCAKSHNGVCFAVFFGFFILSTAPDEFRMPHDL